MEAMGDLGEDADGRSGVGSADGEGFAVASEGCRGEERVLAIFVGGEGVVVGGGEAEGVAAEGGVFSRGGVDGGVAPL